MASSDIYLDEVIRQELFASRYLINLTGFNGLESDFINPFIEFISCRNEWGCLSTIIFPESALHLLRKSCNIDSNRLNLYVLYLLILSVSCDRFLHIELYNILSKFRLKELQIKVDSRAKCSPSNYLFILCEYIVYSLLPFESVSSLLTGTVLSSLDGFSPTLLHSPVDPSQSCYLNYFETRHYLNRLKSSGRHSQHSWLSLRLINYWNVHSRSQYKHLLSPPESASTNYVLPDPNFGIGDYIWEILMLSSYTNFSGKYVFILPSLFLKCCQLVLTCYPSLQGHLFFEELDIISSSSKSDRVIPVSAIQADLLSSISSLQNHQFVVNSSQAAAITDFPLNNLGVHLYSTNTSKPGHDFGRQWLVNILGNTTSMVKILHPIKSLSDKILISELLHRFPGRIDLPSRSVFGDPDYLTEQILSVDSVIGVSSTTTCLSAVLGKKTVVLLKPGPFSSKWSSLPYSLKDTLHLFSCCDCHSAELLVNALFS